MLLITICIYSYNVTTALMQVSINHCLKKATKVLVLYYLMKWLNAFKLNNTDDDKLTGLEKGEEPSMVSFQ